MVDWSDSGFLQALLISIIGVSISVWWLYTRIMSKIEEAASVVELCQMEMTGSIDSAKNSPLAGQPWRTPLMIITISSLLVLKQTVARLL